MLKIKDLKHDLNYINKQFNGIIVEHQDTILANLAIVNQIPAKTFEETNRAKYVLERFLENNLTKAYIDEVGNVVGLYTEDEPDTLTENKQTILLFAQLDTNFSSDIDHNVTFTKTSLIGPGLGDNSLGVALLISLPDIIKKANLKLNFDIILLATTHSQGRGDMAGIRHFIKTSKKKIDIGINLKGVTLGRIDHFCFSRIRCDINCLIEDNKLRSDSSLLARNLNAIEVLNDLINQLLSIPLPSHPKTFVNIGKISGGESYSKPSRKSTLSLEILSEQSHVTQKIEEQVTNFCNHISSKYGIKLSMNFFGKQSAEAIDFSHPLLKVGHEIISMLNYNPVMQPSNTEISVLLAQNIPAITIGITDGANQNLPNGSINIAPIKDGVMQVIMFLYAITQGYCNVTKS